MKLIHWTLTAFVLSLSAPLYAQEAASEETTTEEAAEETKEKADKAMTDLEKAEAAKKAAAKKKADDAKKAKKKAEGENGDEKPAEEATPTAEVTEPAAEPAAAPAAGGMTITDADATVTVEEEKEEEEAKKPWSVSVSLGHSIGSGTFLANEYLRETRERVSQSWSFSGSYRFPLWGHMLSAGVSTGFSVNLVDAQGIDSRQVRLRSTSLSLSDGSVYKDELTGINLNAGLSYSLPSTIESFATNNGSYGSLGLNMGLARKFGDFGVRLGFSMGHTLHKYKVGWAVDTVAGSSWNQWGCIEAIEADDDTAAVYQCATGGANSFLSLSNSLGLRYKITDLLSVSYGLSFSNSFKYAMAGEGDEYTQPGSNRVSPEVDGQSINSSDNEQYDDTTYGATQNQGADTGVGLSRRFSSSFGISYGLSKGIAEWVELPFSLSISAKIAASHPAQDRDGDLFLPLFYNSFGENRAANSYGSVSFALSGSY